MSPDVATKAFRLFSALAKNEEHKRVSAASVPPRQYKNSAVPQAPVPLQQPGLPTNLTKTELQIIALIGQGWANKEVASKLSLSEGTVRNYISSILLKTELRDRTQVAIYAVRHGLAEFYES
jgi:DNA-binding NarL/FixJ family response regulator